MTLARDFLLWGTFLVSAVVTAWTEQEVLWIFLASGVAVMLVTAAATGAIAGAAFVLGKRAIFDVPTAAIAAAALLVLVKARKVPEPVLMLPAGAAGLILRGGSVR
jgi:hypothetical protein